MFARPTTASSENNHFHILRKPSTQDTCSNLVGFMKAVLTGIQRDINSNTFTHVHQESDET